MGGQIPGQKEGGEPACFQKFVNIWTLHGWNRPEKEYNISVLQ